MRRHWIARGLKFVVFATLVVMFAGVVVMTLWNWVMPATFGLPGLTLGRALALLILSRLLLGGFSGPRGRGMHWRHRMRERWEQMSPEERERFMAGMQRGCGRFASRTTETVA